MIKRIGEEISMQLDNRDFTYSVEVLMNTWAFSEKEISIISSFLYSVLFQPDNLPGFFSHRRVSSVMITSVTAKNKNSTLTCVCVLVCV